MILKTRFFGELEIEDDAVIHFKHGIPGFENVKRFVLIDSDRKDPPSNGCRASTSPSLHSL